MKRNRAIFIVVLAALVIGLGVLYSNIKNQPIPRKVLNQAGIGVWYPHGGKARFEVDESTIKNVRSGQDKLITFTAKSGGSSLSFTEQAIPESFTDVPQVYDKMIEKLRGYSNFDSVNGTVALTRPEELKGGQTAVMKAKGTLVFIRPDKDLSKSDWLELINGLNFVH